MQIALPGAAAIVPAGATAPAGTEPDETAVREPGPGRRERWMLIAMILFLDSLLHLLTTHVGGSWDQESSPVAQLAWFCVYMYALGGLIVVRKRAWAAVLQSWPIIVVVALVLLSSFWSTFPDITAKRAFGLFGTSLIGYYMACRFKLLDFLECMATATGIASVLSIICILVFHRIGVMQDEYAGAWQGIYGHKNILAASMVLGIISVTVLALEPHCRRRWYYIGLLGLFGVLLVGSRSATSLLIALVMESLIGFTMLMRSKRYAGITGMTLTLVVGVVAIALPALGVDTQAFFDLLGRDSTLTGRTDIWPYAITAIGDRPWFGWGYKAFWLDNGPVQQYITSDWLPFHAHNGFLELSIDIGLVGCSFFVIAWLLGIWRGIRFVVRAAPSAAPLWPLMAMICFVLSNITEANIATYNTFPWVIFLAAFVYAIPEEKPKTVRVFGYGSVEAPPSAESAPATV